MQGLTWWANKTLQQSGLDEALPKMMLKYDSNIVISYSGVLMCHIIWILKVIAIVKLSEFIMQIKNQSSR